MNMSSDEPQMIGGVDAVSPSWNSSTVTAIKRASGDANCGQDQPIEPQDGGRRLIKDSIPIDADPSARSGEVDPGRAVDTGIVGDRCEVNKTNDTPSEAIGHVDVGDDSVETGLCGEIKDENDPLQTVVSTGENKRVIVGASHVREYGEVDRGDTVDSAGCTASSAPNSPSIAPVKHLPARDCRIAASLQNRYIFECEKIGWRNFTNPRVTSRRRPQPGKGADCQGVRVGAKISPGAASASESREPDTSSISMLPSYRKSPIRGKKVSTEKEPKEYAAPLRHSPPPLPPSSSGRPRRHAADRATAAILAASMDTGGFMVVDFPLGSGSAPKRMRRKRSASAVGAESEYIQVSEATASDPKAHEGKREKATEGHTTASTTDHCISAVDRMQSGSEKTSATFENCHKSTSVEESGSGGVCTAAEIEQRSVEGSPQAREPSEDGCVSTDDIQVIINGEVDSVLPALSPVAALLESQIPMDAISVKSAHSVDTRSFQELKVHGEGNDGSQVEIYDGEIQLSVDDSIC